ncbi:DUF1816 domain-containing protein [Leptolyngbya sp. 7M]|uniref:DUF1816 domain-containing protein n=1 Tax=Leptolyngbya sp. 7M TaxID=2812896 RepID=UPI001B8C9B61|nr:DUF1816 domain-containing protein [Leptolyngbya sp. 7M]QYO64870.1 DUF1816 domain-containing protein [Leptolyngbya sp. 7M]
MNELWLSTLEFLGLAWWIEITTESPNCTYYFGPYVSASEAESDQSGFVEDLEQEGAKAIQVTIKRCKPSQLTIFDETLDAQAARGISPAFSGQM